MNRSEIISINNRDITLHVCIQYVACFSNFFTGLVNTHDNVSFGGCFNTETDTHQ